MRRAGDNGHEPGAEPASTPKPAWRVEALRRALTLVSTGIASPVAGRSPVFPVDLPLTTMASSSREGIAMTPPRLLEQVRAEIRARHYSRRTEDAYVHWIRRFIVFHGRRHPRELGAPEISAFLRWLALEQHVAASTQNQALSGVLFLYREVLRQELGVVGLLPRARTPSKVPVVLTVAEVRQVLDALSGVPRIVAMLL